MKKNNLKVSSVEIDLSDYLTADNTENLVKFQQAIDDLPPSGGTISIPQIDGNLCLTGFNSKHPDFQIVIDKPNISIKGFTNGFVEEDSQFIEPMTNGLKSVFYLTEKAVNFSIFNIGLSIKNRVDSGFFSDEFISRGFFFNSRVFGAKKNSFDLCAYLTTFQHCEAHTFKDSGFSIKGKINKDQGTSIQFLNCYALSSTGIGYELDTLTYSSIINCAVDHTEIGYNIKNSTGVKIDFSGAERTKRPVVVDFSKAITIEGVCIPVIGDEVVNNIIEVNNSYVSISNLYINALTPKYSKKLFVYGKSKVTLIDNSIEANEISNDSTYTGAIDYYGYKASNIRKSASKIELSNDWKGELKAIKNSISQIELSGNLVAGNIDKITKIAQLPNGYYPSENTNIILMELNSGKTITEAIYITAQGGIHVSSNASLVNGTRYSFTKIFGGY